MACHEIGALRLGLMNVLGIEDKALRQHDENEVGEVLRSKGPIQSLSRAQNFKEIKVFFEITLNDLEHKIANLSSDHKDLPYYRSLLILNKKIDLELDVQIKGLEYFFGNLDEMHDFVHEIYN